MPLLADGRTGVIPLQHSTPLIFSHVSIPTKLTIETGATSIQWGYTLNTNIIPTYGGEVQQILSATVDAITITGQTRNNNQLKDIYEWFLQYMQLAGLHNREEQAIKFTYPERGWEFYIQVTQAPNFEYNRDKIAIPWTITAEIVADNDLNFLSGYTMSLVGEAVTFDPSLYDVGFNVEQPSYQPNFGATLSENYQSLLGAWATGDFAHWGFQVLNSPKQNKLNPDAAAIFKDAFGSDFVAGQNANAGAAGAGGSSTIGRGGIPGASWTCSALNADQTTFGNYLTSGTGLNPTVVAAWMHAEEPASRDPQAQGHNWLNIGPGHSYPSAFAAANATIDVINQPNMSSIKGTENRSDAAQLRGIWQSPWDAGHYGGNGSTLYGSYNAVKNLVHMSQGTGSAVADKAAQFALNQIGKPYIFGATGPGGFDCSGLCEAAYQDAGKAIPRTSEEQWAAPYPKVLQKNLVTGDLVYFDTHDGQAAPSHVVMYLGGGFVVSAPHTGTVVQKSALGGLVSAYGWFGANRPAP